MSLPILICITVAVTLEQVEGSDDFWPVVRDRRLRTELFSLNVSAFHGKSDWDGGKSQGAGWVGWTAGSAVIEWNRFRYGTAVAEGLVGWPATSYLPLKLGYTIWNRPVNYVWRIQGMMPEISTEASLYWWNQSSLEYDRVPLAGRADLVVGADAIGAGLSLSVGVLYIQTLDGHLGGNRWRKYQGFSPSIELRFRLATIAFDLAPD